MANNFLLARWSMIHLLIRSNQNQGRVTASTLQKFCKTSHMSSALLNRPVCTLLQFKVLHAIVLIDMVNRKMHDKRKKKAHKHTNFLYFLSHIALHLFRIFVRALQHFHFLVFFQYDKCISKRNFFPHFFFVILKSWFAMLWMNEMTFYFISHAFTLWETVHLCSFFLCSKLTLLRFYTSTHLTRMHKMHFGTNTDC